MPKRQIILFSILGIMLVFYVIDQGWLTGGKSATSNSAIATNDMSEADIQRSVRADQVAYQTKGQIKPFNYSGGWEHDPFYYLTAEEIAAREGGLVNTLFGSDGSSPNLEVTAIMLRGTAGMAIINGEVVGVGDRIAGFEVDKIEQNYVILLKGNQPLRIELGD